MSSELINEIKRIIAFAKWRLVHLNKEYVWWSITAPKVLGRFEYHSHLKGLEFMISASNALESIPNTNTDGYSPIDVSSFGCRYQKFNKEEYDKPTLYKAYFKNIRAKSDGSARLCGFRMDVYLKKYELNMSPKKLGYIHDNWPNFAIIPKIRIKKTSTYKLKNIDSYPLLSYDLLDNSKIILHSEKFSDQIQEEYLSKYKKEIRDKELIKSLASKAITNLQELYITLRPFYMSRGIKLYNK